jgi:hypothetical protein
VTHKKLNPDLNSLDENLAFYKEINSELQSGEKNFYECNELIEKCLDHSIKLIVRHILKFAAS